MTTAGGWGRVQYGGAERGVRDLVTRMDPSRFETTLVCPAESQSYFMEAGAGDCVPLSPRTRFDGRYLASLYRLFRDRRFDIVHLHLLSPVMHGRFAAFAARVPAVISDLHNSLLQVARSDVSKARWLERLYLIGDRVGANHLTDRAIAISEAVARDMRSYGIRESKIATIYNWVDAGQFGFRPASERVRDRQALGLPSDAGTVFALIGRVEPEKAFDLVVEAMARLVDPGHLVVAGEGARLGALRKQVADSGMRGRVHFLGRRSDVERVMGAADFVCLPSRVDGFGRVAVESLSVGCPVIAHPLDGLPDVLGGLPGVTWVQPTVEDWVVALQGAAPVDQAIRESCAHEAQRRYSLPAAMRSYSEMYESIVG